VADPADVPDWLLQELDLLVGFFHDKTTIRGRPNSYGKAVEGIGKSSPESFTIDLTKRTDWKTMRKRLADEGF